VSAIIDTPDDRNCDETSRRWMTQMAGAAIAAAILVRTSIAPCLPTRGRAPIAEPANWA
jgi:hypothetical protein